MYLLSPPERTDPGWSSMNSHMSMPYCIPVAGAMPAAKSRAKRLGRDVKIMKTGGRSNAVTLARTVHPDGSYTMPARTVKAPQVVA
jgi:hypothetical protein